MAMNQIKEDQMKIKILATIVLIIQIGMVVLGIFFIESSVSNLTKCILYISIPINIIFALVNIKTILITNPLNY